MITCQCAEAMPTYAPQSSYLTPIPSANIERGVAPLDSLPADWWNWLWNNITLNEGRIVQFINSVFSEINSVLSAAGVTPSTASTTDLRDAIQKLASTVATSAVPGSVLSSTLSGKLRVIADGTASINDLGTPDQLETTSKEVVSAINEVLALAQGKAPTAHASSDTTYGVGTTQQYGHVKLCDGASSVTAANGVAATPAAVKSVADSLASYQSSNNSAVAGKAPTAHASSDTTYGVGTTQQYGHVKVTEGCGLAISSGTISLNAPGYNCTGTVTAVCYNGTKYTPSSGVVNLGNAPTGFPGYGTAIYPLNGNICCASSAGTSNLVARADHVHQMPSRITNGCGYVCISTALSCMGAANTIAVLRGDVAGVADSAISFSMRGRSGYSGPPVAFCVRPSSDGNNMITCMSNRNAQGVRQFYVPYACYCICSLFASLGAPSGSFIRGAGAQYNLNTIVLICTGACSDITYVSVSGDPIPTKLVRCRCACIGGVFTYIA